MSTTKKIKFKVNKDKFGDFVEKLEELTKISPTLKIKIDEEDILTSRKDVPDIWYTDQINKKHKHYVDIFIKSLNKCIEVKSNWTFNKNKEIVFLKQNAAKELGYSYEIWVYDEKGNCNEHYD